MQQLEEKLRTTEGELGAVENVVQQLEEKLRTTEGELRDRELRVQQREKLGQYGENWDLWKM